MAIKPKDSKQKDSTAKGEPEARLEAEQCSMGGEHRIGQKAIGGFPGHEHTHPSGPQLCLNCDKTLKEILSEAREQGKRDAEIKELAWRISNLNYALGLIDGGALQAPYLVNELKLANSRLAHLKSTEPSKKKFKAQYFDKYDEE